MNNAVEKRFNDLVAKWTKAIKTPKVKVVRIHAAHDEKSFIDDFFEYMLALDTEQEDLVFLLETPWSNMEDFSKELLEELYETIEIWNTAKKPASFPQLQINWKPDYTLGDSKNKAALFVNNVNILVEELVPENDTIVSFILKMPYASSSKSNRWLEQFILYDVHKSIRVGVTDTTTNNIFSNLQNIYYKEVYTLYPNLDLDGCMEEMASMGNPKEPANAYRKYLVKLMNAVKHKKDKQVTENAKKCLDIAVKNVGKNANWLNQVVFVYTLLYNHQMSYKNYKKALFFADKAVEAASLSIGRVEGATAYRLYGQTLLGRGTVYLLSSSSEKAAQDYELAIECYKKCNDFIMQCESTRLYAQEAQKAGRSKKEILERLIEAFYLIDSMVPEHIQNSTYPWVIKKLYYWKGRAKELPESIMKEKLAPYFGEDFMYMIEKYGRPTYTREKFLSEIK
ncbi:hypothetical protein [Tenacibaculum sp.]|uniref:hypothetical protein n=1 Tax=Tenacibaculum sp. TaxID=1906242 RepID=UPI003AA7F7C0